MKTYSKEPGSSEENREIPCPVCKSRIFRPHWNLGTYGFQQCGGCGLVLQNPQPLREALASRYDDQYFSYEKENEEVFFGLMKKGLDDIRFAREVEPSLPSPPRVLDIGCATGRLLKDFKEKGWGVQGVEICGESAAYGRGVHGVDIYAGPLEEAGFAQDSFSAVHASHLIEHVNDPAAFAAEVFRVLAPGGVFVCVTPARDGLQARLFGSRWRSVIPDHVTLFDKKTLASLLEGAGMKVEKVRTWGGLAQGAGPVWIKKILDKGAKIFGYGDVMIMLARKR